MERIPRILANSACEVRPERRRLVPSDRTAECAIAADARLTRLCVCTYVQQKMHSGQSM